MPKDFKLATIEAKDESSQAEIIAAFGAQFNNPVKLGADGLPLKDGEGKETGELQFTPEGLVKHHVNNFIRSVVSQQRQSEKRKQIEDAGVVSKEFLK